MKRIIALLVVLAGGLAAAALSIPTNAAVVNGVGISQDRVNGDLAAIASSLSYQCFLNAEQLVGSGGQVGLTPVVGAGPTGGGRPSVTTQFASTYVDTLVGHQLLEQVAARDHVTVTDADVTAARTQLASQIASAFQEVAGSQYACVSSVQAATGSEVLATLPTSFVDENARFEATANALETHLAGVGPSTAALASFFEAHAAQFDTVSFTVAEFSSQSAAQTAAAQVTSGTPFSQVATKAGGGAEGPAILYDITSQLPAGSNVQNLPVGTVSPPIALNGAYLLLQITSRSPSSFAQAETEVQAAVRNAGAAATSTAVNQAEKRAQVSVDPRYGSWTPASASVLPPPSPPAGDVLNVSANGGTVAAAAPATGSGSTTSP